MRSWLIALAAAAMLAMPTLAQADAPPPVPCFVLHPGRVASQLLREDPPPVAGSGMADSFAADEFGLGPLFLGVDYRHFAVIAVALREIQVVDFPEFHVPLARFVVKLLPRCCVLLRQECVTGWRVGT